MAESLTDYPSVLFEDIEDESHLASRLARFETLKELGAFGLKTMIKLSINNEPGTFNGRVRKSFSGLYGDTRGCSEGDIECAALMVGQFDELYDYEIRLKEERRGRAA